MMLIAIAVIPEEMIFPILKASHILELISAGLLDSKNEMGSLSSFPKYPVANRVLLLITPLKRIFPLNVEIISIDILINKRVAAIQSIVEFSPLGIALSIRSCKKREKLYVMAICARTPAPVSKISFLDSLAINLILER